ncbi:hypothetical protein HUA78_30540 [Myxococcus sp. CA033]|uniref:hypothetical protein n=1 Tax=Myxococcus sp. CA033 TaxID=2741516 RepID=UPI00157A9717|nr:hypothetical protein [Myxococcus sp. CA033]NTX38792.1 hypothetical protein [Myxococcus sp. CA033]
MDLDLVSEGSGHVTACVAGGIVKVSLDASGSVDPWGNSSQARHRWGRWWTGHLALAAVIP